MAGRASGLLEAAAIATAFDGQGFDHGVFVPLKIAPPKAKFPCAQTSLKAGLGLDAHLTAGAALAPLREEGVLIIGSDNSFHNMQEMIAGMHGRSRVRAVNSMPGWRRSPPTRVRNICYPCMWWLAPPLVSHAARCWKITSWAPWRVPLNMEVWRQAMSFEFPPRPGERPRTTPCAPHTQISQNSAPEVHRTFKVHASSCLRAQQAIENLGPRGRGSGAIP